MSDSHWAFHLPIDGLILGGDGLVSQGIETRMSSESAMIEGRGFGKIGRGFLPRRHSEAQRPALSGARAEPERREGPGVALFAPSGPPDSARKRLGPFGSEPNRPLRAAQGMPAGAPGTARGAWRAIRPGLSLREAAPEGTPPPASGSPAPSWDARSGGPGRP